MQEKKHIATALILLALMGTASAANHYIRAGATCGAGCDGSDWNKAWTNLPTSLVRGDTYYIADGNYGKYIFNDPEDGEKYIYIKKAIESDHGTETGWQSSYGNGVALFTTSANPEAGIIWFQKSYYVFDGQVGGGPGSWKTGHGFKINSTAEPGVGEGYLAVYLISLRDQWPDYISPDFLEIRHVELEHRGVDSGDVDAGIYHVANPCDGINTETREIFKGKAGPDNVIISHSYFHDFGWNPIQTSQCSNWLFEYNYVARNTSVPEGLHGNGWQDFGSDDMTIRYNIWEDIEGTAVIAHKHDTISTVDLPPGADQTYWVNENWYIYGNVFFYSPDNPYERGGCGHGVVGATAWNDAPTNNLLFYNNIIVNQPGWNSGIMFEYGTGNKVYNNIWFDSSRYIVDSGVGTGQDYYPRGTPNVYIGDEGVVEYNYNIYSDSPLLNTSPDTNDIITSGDPFVAWENLDFSLTSATEAGLDLEAPYNIDMFGNERGADGTWDRGAIEFRGTGECFGTDTSCGEWPDCLNCDLNDDCVGDTNNDYYCLGTSCAYREDDCNDCSCSCGGYNTAETLANNNCLDGKDNDCDSQTDSADIGCQECVDTPALLNYISQWKQGQTTMQTLMQRIALWKTGC